MNMTATVNMRMPRNFTDMDAKEIEYDGGISTWGWFFIGCAIAVVGGLLFGITGGTIAGLLGAETAESVLAAVGTGIAITGLAAAAVGGVIYGGCKLYDAYSQ